MYRLTLNLDIEHSDEGDGYEPVKQVKETLLVGDENHPEMPNHLAQMVRRLFTRLQEVKVEPKVKIHKPGLVKPTGAQTAQVNRISKFGD